jgi:hypothetical protein
MKSLAEKAALLNALKRRQLEVEAQVKMIVSATSLQKVIHLKREHARLVKRIANLEAKLK